MRFQRFCCSSALFVAMRVLLLCSVFVPAMALAGDEPAPKKQEEASTRDADSSPQRILTDPAEGDGIPSADSSRPGLAIDDLASVDPSTGVGRSRYAFVLPQPRGGRSVGLSINYNSSVLDSDLGVGWSLDVPSIERRSASGTAHPKYSDPPVGQPIHLTRTDLNSQDEFYYAGAPMTPVCFIHQGSTCTDTTIPDFAASGGWHLYRLFADHGEGLRFFWSPDHKTWVILSNSGEIREMGVSLDEGTRLLVGKSTDDELLLAPKSSAPYRWKLSRRFDNHRGSDGRPLNVIYYAWNSDGSLSDIYHTDRVGSPQPSPQVFAHHIRLNYEPYEFPRAAARPDHIVWHTTPIKRLSGVDVTSAETAGARELVRRTTFSTKGSRTIRI